MTDYAAITTTTLPILTELPMPGVRLFVGGHANWAQNTAVDLAGDRMFTAVHTPPARMAARPVGLLDSGAFSDAPQARLTPDRALQRQLNWEARAAAKWGFGWQAQGLVSYDLLIDETWIAGEKHKRRWLLSQADWAIEETITNARYLATQRANLAPRTLILSCQGVDAIQYQECATEVLKGATSADWIGLGGWCILGRFSSWLPTFWQAMRATLPIVAAAGVAHVHIFGVLYQPALAGLLWLADQYGLTVSTDSSAPILACTRGDLQKSGARRDTWRANVQWWIDTLANLRSSVFYREPPRLSAARQECFL